MDIRVGKMRIGGTAVIALLAAYLFDRGEVLAAVVVAAAVHELGHCAAIRAFGRRVEEIRCDVWGCLLRCDRPLPYSGEIVSAAAGPASGALLALAAAAAGRFFDSAWAHTLSGVSAVLTVFNAMPALPLDGGQMMRAAVEWGFGPAAAHRAARYASAAVIAALFVWGAAVFFSTRGNFSVLLGAACLLGGYCQTCRAEIKSVASKEGNGRGPWTKSLRGYLRKFRSRRGMSAASTGR